MPTRIMDVQVIGVLDLEAAIVVMEDLERSRRKDAKA